MITAYLGFNGSGKTLSMCKEMTGYDTVFTNFNYIGRGFQKVCRRTDTDELIDLLLGYTGLIGVGTEKIVLGVDEAGLNFPARAWKGLSKKQAYLFAQHRKSGIDFLYTAQNAKMVDSMLRNNTAMSSYPRHFFGLFYETFYEGVEKTKDMFLYRNMWLGGRYYHLYNTLEVVESTKFYLGTLEVGKIDDWGVVFQKGGK